MTKKKRVNPHKIPLKKIPMMQKAFYMRKCMKTFIMRGCL